MIVHRAPIISAAARNNVAAAYNQSAFARDGGLLSYGPDQVDSRLLCRSHPARREAGRSPGAVSDQLQRIATEWFRDGGHLPKEHENQ
jgi:hypothetical protein